MCLCVCVWACVCVCVHVCICVCVCVCTCVHVCEHACYVYVYVCVRTSVHDSSGVHVFHSTCELHKILPEDRAKSQRSCQGGVVRIMDQSRKITEFACFASEY